MSYPTSQKTLGTLAATSLQYPPRSYLENRARRKIRHQSPIAVHPNVCYCAAHYGKKVFHLTGFLYFRKAFHNDTALIVGHKTFVDVSKIFMRKNTQPFNVMGATCDGSLKQL